MGSSRVVRLGPELDGDPVEAAPEDVGMKVGGSFCLDGRSRAIEGHYHFVPLAC